MDLLPSRRVWSGLKRSFRLLSLMLLTGCAALPPSGKLLPPGKPPPREWLLGLNRWRLEGRFAAQGAERVQGRLSWRHLERHDLLFLTGPLGIGAVSISITPLGVEVRRGKERFRAPSPEAMFGNLLGMRVPWKAMLYWIRGLPAPGTVEARSRADGYLAELHQKGWRVVFHRYHPVGPAALPKRLTLFGPGGIRLKLIIDRWQIEETVPHRGNIWEQEELEETLPPKKEMPSGEGCAFRPRPS